MNHAAVSDKNHPIPAYLTAAGAWALAFGCSVGWGAFVMPGNTFLPLAGPLGTTIGIGAGAVIMIILAMNYHFLMNRFPDGGGTYTYTKKCFGYDQGFLSAWFLFLTYIAIIWANATALPLIARTLLGSTFQFGFHYEIAGFQIYAGEILLALGSLAAGALICLRRDAAQHIQILMAVLLFAGIVICFAAASGHLGTGITDRSLLFVPGRSRFSSSLTILALTPWAFVGFESISHSAEEARFSLKHAFLIMTIAVITASLAYIFLALLAVTALPEGRTSWADYLAHLDAYQGITSQPTFYAAYSALGRAGSLILGVASLGGIFTGLIGNYIALSRPIHTLSEDGMISGWIGSLDENHTPRNAILSILAISAFLPFFGRTAISWIVDVTTVGATIAYTFTSAAAWKMARQESNRTVAFTGILGMLFSLMFAVAFLVPNILGITTLSTESYLILAVWGILGFVVFRILLNRDHHRRMGRSTIAWIILLGLVMFTSSVWMYQSIVRSIRQSLIDAGIDGPALERIVQSSVGVDSIIQIGIVVLALIILFNIYSLIQKREKQIEVEKALAEKSSKAKTSFLSNMSHEIRTPMNAIIGLDNIALRNPDLSPKTREHLEKIGASARHLLGLINDILDMSRIESGRMTLKSEEFSFREFLDQINIIINGQCIDKGLHYECHITGRVSDYYFGDDMKLKQVLINILGNSVKFTDPPGEVSLSVEELDRDEDSCTMRFIMRDTGIGMDQEYIPKIFEAFSQEDEGATSQYGGTGLGMAITRNFVEMMEGLIEVESEKGVGSVFTVTVPLEASDRRARDELPVSLPENLRTIVVDDDEIACEHAQMALEAIGIEAESCTDPSAALALIREAHDQGHPYQLMLTDYRMPSMNGLELVRAVRSFDDKDMVVIMLTGYNWDIIEEEARADGVDGILAKPLFSDSLLKIIHTLLLTREGFELSVPVEEESEQQEENLLAGRRVLMAEDVDQNAEILEDLLDLEDIMAEHAVNGAVAVDMFSDRPEGYYDAILMDVRMPVMDGLTATRTIRSLERSDAKTIPIIAMTANVFDEDVERSLQAGMNAHLSKPIEPDKLYETMTQLIVSKEEEA